MDPDFEARELIRHAVHPIQGISSDYTNLMQAIGDAPLVLLGEATHGTHEFYRERTRITQQLILEKGFNAIAVEADWPDSYTINRYIRSNGSDKAISALDGFKRFPTWMWRNHDVLQLIEWLHGYNIEQPENHRVGFYGLDLYSLFTSIHAVIEYLNRIDPKAAEEAQKRYACFDRFDRDLQDYGFMSAYGLGQSCEDEVIRQLLDLRQHAWDYAHRDGQIAEEAFFNAEMNARLARNAEKYYRTMFQGRVNSWNLRDTHMFETLNSLMNHLSQHRKAKVVVWAHNSHIGNAAATEMGQMGELNIGQLARQQFKHLAFLVGFSTNTGTVTAASNWDAPAERKRVRPALPHSYEQLFHQTGIANYLIVLRNDRSLSEALRPSRLQRAIGVIYQPTTERQSHYFHASLPEQFDAIIHMDETRAVEPLERGALWERGEVPETFPSTF
jgi:erythromycin esterase-like protein